MILGMLGVALLVAILGSRPNPVAAIMQGALFGLVLEVVILNLIVNQVQDVNTVYTSTPEWSWWISHAIYGMTLGLVAALLLGRAAPAVETSSPMAGVGRGTATREPEAGRVAQPRRR